MSNNDDSEDLANITTSIWRIAYDTNDKELNLFSEQIRDRVTGLKLGKIRIPVEYFETSKKMTEVYRESIICYLLGMPNSCFPSIVSVLEDVLKKKYAAEEDEPKSKMRLVDLVNWAIKFLGNTDDVDSFRRIRNHIHDDKPINLSNCAEAIRHITIIINRWYARDEIKLDMVCLSCKRPTHMTLPDHNALFIGSTLSIKCNKCGFVYEGTTLIGPRTIRTSSGINDPPDGGLVK